MVKQNGCVRLRSELDALTRAVGGPAKLGKVIKGISTRVKSHKIAEAPLQGTWLSENGKTSGKYM